MILRIIPLYKFLSRLYDFLRMSNLEYLFINSKHVVPVCLQLHLWQLFYFHIEWGVFKIKWQEQKWPTILLPCAEKVFHCYSMHTKIWLSLIEGVFVELSDEGKKGPINSSKIKCVCPALLRWWWNEVFS